VSAGESDALNLLSVRRRVLHFFLSLPYPNNRLENIYFFYLSLLNSATKSIFLGRKILEEHLSSLVRHKLGLRVLL